MRGVKCCSLIFHIYWQDMPQYWHTMAFMSPDDLPAFVGRCEWAQKLSIWAHQHTNVATYIAGARRHNAQSRDGVGLHRNTSNVIHCQLCPNILNAKDSPTAKLVSFSNLLHLFDACPSIVKIVYGRIRGKISAVRFNPSIRDLASAIDTEWAPEVDPFKTGDIEVSIYISLPPGHDLNACNGLMLRMIKQFRSEHDFLCYYTCTSLTMCDQILYIRLTMFTFVPL